MNNDKNNILDQIAEDSFVQGAWKFQVAWFLFRLVAVTVVFLKIVIANNF